MVILRHSTFEPQRQKTYLWTCAFYEDLDQPAHSHNMIRIIIGQTDRQGCKVSSCGQRSLLSDCAGCADWFECVVSTRQKLRFLTLRLISLWMDSDFFSPIEEPGIFVYSAVRVHTCAIQERPVSILHISIAGRYRPVRVADGPIKARCRFIKNTSWDIFYIDAILSALSVQPHPPPPPSLFLSLYMTRDVLSTLHVW